MAKRNRILCTKVYEKIFMQMWILLLSSLVFIYGILLLTDLKNYKLVLMSDKGRISKLNVDDNGDKFVNVYRRSEYNFCYCRSFDSFGAKGGNLVKDNVEYRVVNAEYYLDIYERCDDDLILIKTIEGREYSENFYDIEYGWRIEVEPRVENVRYAFPAWRYYVPIIIFLLTLPIMILSGYNMVIKGIEIAKKKKESDIDIDGNIADDLTY